MTNIQIENKTFNDKLRSLILKLDFFNDNRGYGKLLRFIGLQAKNNKPNYKKFIQVFNKTGLNTKNLLKSMILDREIKQELNVLFTEYSTSFGDSNISLSSREIYKMKQLYNNYNYKQLIHELEDQIVA